MQHHGLRLNFRGRAVHKRLYSPGSLFYSRPPSSGSGIRTISASSPLLPGQLLPPARAQGAFPSSPRQHASTVVGMKRQRHSPLLERCCLLLPSLWLLLIIHPPTGQGCPASILKTVDRRPLLSSRPSPSPDDKGGPSPTRS